MVYLAIYSFIALILVFYNFLQLSIKSDQIWEQVKNPLIKNHRGTVMFISYFLIGISYLFWPVGIPFWILVARNGTGKVSK